MSYQTIIPIQLTLLGMHRCSHVLSQSVSKAVVLTIAVKVLGMLQHTPLIELKLTLRDLFSLAIKMPNFWDPKIDKKVINSSTKCLISVKIAILTPHIIPPSLVNVWFVCRNMSADFVYMSIHSFKEHTSFVWIYSQLQINTVLYVSPRVPGMRPEICVFLPPTNRPTVLGARQVRTTRSTLKCYHFVFWCRIES